MKKFLISFLLVLALVISIVAVTTSAKGVFSNQTLTIQCVGGDVVVSGSFENTDSVGDKYNVYCATYDADGRMNSVQVSEALTITNGTNNFSSTFDIVSKEQKTKVFVLTTGMSPVCKSVEKTIRSFRVFAIGNSYSEDSLQYLDDIARMAGFDNILLGNMVIGGCDLSTHLSNASNNSKAYSYQKNTTGSWVKTDNKSLLDGLLDEDWDYITLQQASGSSGLPGTYNSDLTNLINFVNEHKTNEDAVIGWHMTWAYGNDYYTYNTTSAFDNHYNSDQMTMYRAIVDAVQTKILTNPDISFVIPTGTAVQNARTSFIGDHFNRDGTHLDYYYGRYLAGLTWFRAITGLGIDNFNFRLNNDFPESYLPILKESVNNAINKPYQVTSFIKDDDNTNGDADGVFSIAIIPDTQGEVNGNTAINRRHFLNRTLWLADQQDELDLRCVVHTGDVVNWGDADHSQLVIAAEAMEVLPNAGIPTVITLGNHDTAAVGVGGGAADSTQTKVRVRDTSAFNSYLPISKYKGLVPFETGKIDNSYLTFEACGTKWLVIALELWPRDVAIKWAEGVIKSKPDHNVIISTHSYLNSDGTIYQGKDYGEQSPQYLYDNLVKKYENIKFVLCGHVGDSRVRTDTGVNGNKIVSLLGCFHASTNPVKILNIDVNKGEISGYVYVPFDNARWSQYDFAVSGLEFIKSDTAGDTDDDTTGDPYDEIYSDYNRLDLDVNLGYYNSTVGNSFYNTSDNSKEYVGTQRFTRDDLPNGTLIVIDAGYKYRPEGWIDLNTKNDSATRPGEVSDTVVEINDAWWGDFTYRAFNIYPNTKADLTNSVDEVASHFRIYVPKDIQDGEDDTDDGAYDDPYDEIYSDYNRLDLDVNLGYYNSTVGSSFYNTSDNSKEYVGTQRFTRDDLPNGTLIVIDEGYKYRPEGWIDLNTKNDSATRPGEVSDTVVEINDEWWGDFTYRAFNIYPNTKVDLTNSVDEVASHFRIYVPK